MDVILALAILGLITIIVSIILAIFDDDKIIHITIGTFISIIIFIVMIIYSTLIINTPTAIDVYRNNTTLEITYKDSIPIDTVVVFKNK